MPIAVVTGSSTGIGQASAITLARAGHTVYATMRNPQTGGEELRLIADKENLPLRLAALDVDSDQSVDTAFRAILKEAGRIDVLVNNAGIGINEPGGGARQESADKIELRFAVNYLAGYALSSLLLPLLVSSAPSRIVNVASIGQQAIDFDDVMLTRDYDGMRAYRQSKLAQIMNTFDLAEELQAKGVTVNALHPATFMPTKVSPAKPVSTIAQGVEATLRLITAPPEQTGTGRFFNGQEESRANDQAYDADARRRLRELSGRLTGL
jgi:NAD(P)-dependent dehydrogenase (short-subunit alcohol dehydrogenase family)